MNAVIYTRVACRDKSAKELIELQETKCKREAIKQGCTIVAEFSDIGQSSNKFDRPGLQELMNYIVKNKVDKVIVTSVDRLARNVASVSEIRSFCDKHHVQIVSLESTTTNAEDTLMENIIRSIKDFDKQLRSERAKKFYRDRKAATA